ncbi:hypothetical protein FQR65_LT07027 [Abscondita terminalis]|nr:hypothetical protein FQR65_LT07027 [Abscondita terminalis]
MRLLPLIAIITVCTCDITGPNVCLRKEPYTEEVRVSELKPYQSRELKWCFSSTLRCSKLVTKYKIELKSQYFTKWRTVSLCCDGFTLNLNKTRCVPNCSKGCVNGICTHPEVCKCENGYGGSTCSFSCPLSLYGKLCEHDCLCKNNATCDALTGKCTCSKGWRGTHCERPCETGTYGEDCLEACKCDRGECDPVTGDCNCAPGWTGKFCTFRIQKLKTKQSVCTCRNGGSCTLYNKGCKCTPGWIGNNCEQKCDTGYWGPNCSEKCSCFKDGICDHITGKCICPSGYIGYDCSNTCPLDTYGKDCAFNCTCNERGLCSNIDGSCTCYTGWSGNTCNITSNMKLKEHLLCICKNTNFICDDDQKCVCRNGYEGDNCNVPIKNNSFVYGIVALGIILTSAILITCVLSIRSFKITKRYCSANQDEASARRSEQIELETLNNTTRIYSGNNYINNRPDHVYTEIEENYSCYNKLSFNNPIRGVSKDYDKVKQFPKKYIDQVIVSVLKPIINAQNITKYRRSLEIQDITKWKSEPSCCDGYTVNVDKTFCVPRCLEKCVHGECAAPDTCQCYEGYVGFTCNISRPLLLYEKDDPHECLCKNNSTCDSLTGKCSCLEGWKGPYCELPCQPGSYGKNCSETCKCDRGECHHVTGNCTCPSGWTGKFCSDAKLKKHKCTCLNGGSCVGDSNFCVCAPGWFGKQCEQKCSSGYWGQNCRKSCSCFNNVNCNHSTGECICPSGLTGNKCADVCPRGTFGQNCAYKCSCTDHGVCSNIDGVCSCFEGWSGSTCNISLSVNVKDNLSCVCKNNFICDQNNNCVCPDGYEGSNCDLPVMSTMRWIIYGGISLGVLLVCAILTNCVLSITSLRKKNLFYSTNYNAVENRSYGNNEEFPFIPPNNVAKTKNVNLCQDTSRYTPVQHFYEEIKENENPFRYDRLNFFKPNCTTSGQYQEVSPINIMNNKIKK